MYYFIVNPGSRTGNGMGLWNSLEEQVRAAKIDYEVFFTKGAGDATRFAEQICAEHPEEKYIIVVGGDGTVDEAANGLSGYDNIIFGCVPTGSGNDLARGLGLGKDSAAAMDRILHNPQIKSVDHGLVRFMDGSKTGEKSAAERVGTADSRRFPVSSGIGYDADVCHEALTSPLKSFLNKLHLGSMIYYILGVKLIFTNKRAKATLIIDGNKKIETNALLCASAMNTCYQGGGMLMAPAADPGDGKITMCIIHDVSRMKHLLLMPKVIKGEHVKYDFVEQITCSTCEIISDRPLAVHTDGEYVGDHSHLIYSCQPGQIRMIV